MASVMRGSARTRLEALFGAPESELCTGDELAANEKVFIHPFHLDPPKWWRGKQAKFPKLAEATRDYLARPCGSVHSERIFFRGRRIFFEWRQLLGPEIVQRCILLKS